VGIDGQLEFVAVEGFATGRTVAEPVDDSASPDTLVSRRELPEGVQHALELSPLWDADQRMNSAPTFCY